MKLYFHNRKRYPAEEQPQYYNVTKGIAGFVDKQDCVCLFEGTVEEFENTEDNQARTMYRKSWRAQN